MASTYTTNLRLELQGTGDNSGTWGGVANNQFTLLDKAIGGMTSVGMTDGINTLSALNGSDDQSRQPVIYLYGALTTVAYLEIPNNSKKPYYIWNNTSGNKPITVRHPVGSTGMVVPSSAISAIYSTGTSVVPLAPAVDFLGGLYALPSPVSTSLLTANGITGVSAGFSDLVSVKTLKVSTSARLQNIDVLGTATFALGARVSGAELSATSATLTNLGSTNLSATTGTFTSVATSVANISKATTALAIATPVSITYSSAVTLDFSLGNNFNISPLTGNLSLIIPTNQTPGQGGTICLTQDGTGNRVITWDGGWLFEGGADPLLSTPANSKDVLSYYVLTSGSIVGSLGKAFS